MVICCSHLGVPSEMNAEDKRKNEVVSSIHKDEGSLPEVFYVSEEIPARPHSYLRDFELVVLHKKTGKWIYDCRVASPSFEKTTCLLVDSDAVDTSFLSLQDIENVIHEAVEKGMEWKVVYILFYDTYYKRFVHLTEENFPQCLSFVFRVLVEEADEGKRNETEAADGSECSSTEKPKELELFISPSIKSLLEETPLSNPPYPSEQPNKLPFVFELSKPYKNSERLLTMKDDARCRVLKEEDVKRKNLQLEGGAKGATLKAIQDSRITAMEVRDRVALFMLEEKEDDMLIHERQQHLMREVKEFLESTDANKQTDLAIES